MIVVVFQNPNPADPVRKNANLELRMMIEGITLDEANALGDAINLFAVTMNRRHTLNAFQLEDELGNR